MLIPDNVKSKLYRIIDANLNRSREGLRVIEDVTRFCLNDKRRSGVLKKIRHQITHTVTDFGLLLSNRDSKYDVGKEFSNLLEGRKKDIPGLIISNFRRVEESLRVLEDVSKVINPKKSREYKDLRFRVYSLEKSFYDNCKIFKKKI